MSNKAARFDPVTLEILWQRLISIVDEADAMAIGVMKIINSKPLDAYNEGDVFIVNDP